MKLAKTAQADGNLFETIKYYLLSQEPEKALPIGINFIKGKLQVDIFILIHVIFSFMLTINHKIKH